MKRKGARIAYNYPCMARYAVSPVSVAAVMKIQAEAVPALSQLQMYK